VNLRPRDAGDTLIEILLAVMVIGIMATGIVGAMTAAARGSGSHQAEASAQTLAVTAAERVQQAAWTRCATSAAYLGAARSAFNASGVPAGWTSGVIALQPVKYWTSLGWQTTGCVDYNGSGGPTTEPNGGLQLIQIVVKSPDNRVTESVSVVKRNANDVH
jgi:Tfp pilus assembly protein PilV